MFDPLKKGVEMLFGRDEHPSGPPHGNPEARPNATLRRYTLLALAVGLVCILMFSANVTQGQSFLERIGASSALSLGAVILGSLLGFVFGIPRTLQHDANLTPSQNPNPITPEQERIGYQINTNLEQISDWLTKIIIGVGLVQLGSIGQWLMTFSGVVGGGFGNSQLGQIYVLGILLYFSGSGFLLGYLWTVGQHTRDNDLEVNVLKGKKLTNIRTHSKDEAVRLTPPMQMTLEKALAYIEDDELVEVTPKSIRLRKGRLDPNDRKRAERAKATEGAA
jgi:hypothetical protein